MTKQNENLSKQEGNLDQPNVKYNSFRRGCFTTFVILICIVFFISFMFFPNYFLEAIKP